MAERPGVLFRFDLLDAIEQLDPADAGRLFVGALRYGECGKAPNFQNPVLSIVWALLKASIDADGERYAEKVLQTRYATYVREVKKAEQKPMSFEDWKSSFDTGRYQSVPSGIQYNNNPIQSNNNINPIQEQVQGQCVAAPPPAPARDDNGLILLSDADYNQLREELGESELSRVISYLSGYCRLHGKIYPDWPFAIRKASKEGWGKPAPGKGTTPVTDFQPSADRIKENNDWLDSFLAEQAKKEGSGKWDNLPGATRL